MLEHHSNDTSHQVVSFGNIILKISTKAGYENVALLLKICSADGTAEIRVAAIQCTFLEGRDLLNNWCDVNCRMFPYQQYLLDKLPDPMKLIVARLTEHVWLMTDM